MGTRVIGVGASAGGVRALKDLVGGLPPDFPGALLIVLHVPANSPSQLESVLGGVSAVPVTAARNGERIRPGHVYVASPGHHLLVNDGTMALTRGAQENRHRPAVDPLFRSLARAYGADAVGVVLSGMLDDGVAGLLAIKEGGGTAVVQNPEDAEFQGMPLAALRDVEVDHTLPASAIGPLLARLAARPAEVADGPAPPTDARADEPTTGPPSMFTCPDCGGVLHEEKRRGLRHYRCTVGHAYSPESMDDGQRAMLEEALWAALRLVEQRRALRERMADDAEARGFTGMSRGLRDGIPALLRHERALRDALVEIGGD